ncbi:hypothetical protein [Saccharopolyspora taberi]|uniref:Scaffolding protein n=1 Tax=Saccharopolyspora taberi TaxID=60895 RepID=A0ABN3UZG3_9PSEU
MHHLPIHPVTGLRALGFTRRGPIWPVLGGSTDNDPTGDNGNQGGQPGQQDTGQGNDNGQNGGTGQQGGQPDNTGQQGDAADDLANLEPAALAKMVRDLRKENASTRTNAKQQAATEAAETARTELVQQLGKALGLIDDGSKAPTADELAQQLTARDTELRSLRVERAAEKAARKHTADIDALLDSRSFAAELDKLDPNGDSFAADIDKLVSETVRNNPKYKAAGQAPGRSSSEHAGGSGAGSKPKSLTDAVAARYGRA